MDEDGDDGLSGEYGVMIVPPTSDTGAWLVTLGKWNLDREAYIASGDGPLLESREEALTEAQRVMDWLAGQADATNVTRVWQQMQEQRGAEEGLNEVFLKSRNPWNI